MPLSGRLRINQNIARLYSRIDTKPEITRMPFAKVERPSKRKQPTPQS